MKYNVLIGGAAGQGIDTISSLLEKILMRKGYFVFSSKDYMSRVRGGHNFIQIRFGSEPIYSHWPELDLIVALDRNTIDFHRGRLKEDSAVFCDETLGIEEKGIVLLPLKSIGAGLKNPKVSGSAAAGAVLKFFGESLEYVSDILKEKFDLQTAEANYLAFRMGYDSIEGKLNPVKTDPNSRILINGNQAIALGALAGGLGLYASYPMTPATSIMTWLSHKQREAGILVEQVEDEISAVNMALGSSYAGVRSMVGTSGGGLALMVEGLSLQGVMEIPLVVVNSQRPGPATGLPTRTGQEDLGFVLTAGHGEFPKMIISIRNPEDAFYQTARALNIADKYQVLVILLTDEYLADSSQTINPYDFNRITIERHFTQNILMPQYKRYEFTEDGVSPRIAPGRIEGIVSLADSHEHDEYGHITEDAVIRRSMVIKRMKKLEGLKSELMEPEYFGPEQPDLLLLGWGSMYGPLREVVQLLREDGINTGCLTFGDLYPFPAAQLNKYASVCKRLVNVEQNFTGQLARLIRQETGIDINQSLLTYDGRQMSSLDIYSRIKKEVL